VARPTMADIADHLGISRPLVSIVLRNAPGASAETRQRVLRAARELGYTPHQGARSLRQTCSAPRPRRGTSTRPWKNFSATAAPPSSRSAPS